MACKLSVRTSSGALIGMLAGVTGRAVGDGQAVVIGMYSVRDAK